MHRQDNTRVLQENVQLIIEINNLKLDQIRGHGYVFVGGVYVVESSGRAQTPYVTELVGIGSSSSVLVGDLIPG